MAHQKPTCAMLKLVKTIFDGRHRRRRVTVHSIQALFDFAARFPFQKQESNHRLILLFIHFSKICRLARFHTWSKQNYESDSAEIFNVAIYENVLHDSKSLLQCWHHRAVGLSTYRTILVYRKPSTPVTIIHNTNMQHSIPWSTDSSTYP